MHILQGKNAGQVIKTGSLRHEQSSHIHVLLFLRTVFIDLVREKN